MKQNKGIALITVLWVMALLMVIVTEFANSMKTEVNITRNLKEEMEVYLLAKAGINLAIAEIVQDTPYHYVDRKGTLLFGELRAKRTDIPLGNGKFSYVITDEESKININSASKERLTEIFGSIGGDIEVITDSIIDWRDSDKLYHENGAEDDYYRRLPTPYGSKDTKFDTIEELLLVRGVTPSIFGTDASKGITSFLTVRNNGINYNTASEKVLTILYGEERAAKIVEERDAKDGIYSLSSKSSNFTIVSTGKSNNSPATVTIKARVEKISTGRRKGIRIDYWDDNYIKPTKGEKKS